MPANGVDFVDEDDARGILFRLFEHVAHAAGADAHEHFNEVRTGNGEERHIGFARDGARQKRLARARRSNQKCAFWNLAAKPLELVRVLEEVNDFHQVFLGLVDAGHVFKGHAALLFGQQLRL